MRTSPRLSSSFLTLLHKWILLASSLLACIVWIYVALRGDTEMWTAIIFWGVASVALLLWSWPIKRVTIEGDFFIISNYFTSYRVPIAHLTDVTEGFGTRLRRIILHFEPKTPFGKRICIIPPQGSSISDRKSFDEVTAFLQSLVKNRKRL
jgi:hypothetical protein